MPKRWSDFDAGTVAVMGKVVRQRGVGLVRVDETKTAAGRRSLPLPSFAVATLTERRNTPFLGQQTVIFSINERHAARPRRLFRAMACGPR